ncbi:MAG: NAD(P)-dependent glycerol-3-phosphate dehydrogenase [Deltaproteobacteria bacterium]|nr:NAD(P)-dependent glycerol-3-phosphate dehydrogenase [Deltaproteobacteria bacterium]
MGKKITVIGAGAWGTAFSMHLSRLGNSVCLWVYENDLYDILSKKRENTYYLPGFYIPESIQFTTDFNVATKYSNDIVVSVPSHAFRSVLEKIKDGSEGKKFLILTKGLDFQTSKRMSEIVKEILGQRKVKVAVLSGPSFAKEVASGVFTSVVVASEDRFCSKYFQRMLHSTNFRVYTTDDLIGVELGGALKNVMAIGAGIIQGLSLGTNTLSAYITRALAEMKRFGKALGARESTFMGLSGMGDLILTSFGPLSRNRWFGIELANGKNAKDLIESQRYVIEGYYSLKAVYNLSKKIGVEMPIVSELFYIVFEGKDIRASMRDITERAMKDEDE